MNLFLNGSFPVCKLLNHQRVFKVGVSEMMSRLMMEALKKYEEVTRSPLIGKQWVNNL
jgi:hypothetical protein